MRALERVAIALVSLALSIGLIALLSGFFASHDSGSLSGQASGPGQSFPDQGDAVLVPGQLRPPYNSDPPTSGPHVPRVVTRDGVALSDDQLLSALSRGNVVLLYSGRSAPAALRTLASSLAGPFAPALAAAGQAVILSPRRGTSGIVAVAWNHLLRTGQPTDPQLREFVSFWLGRVAFRQ
jgi:hypothetical protein